MNDFQKSQANKIKSCYNNIENIIEKGGPGSGRHKYDHNAKDLVLGKTKSGKTIYFTPEHDAHKDFTNEDHKDAIKFHDEMQQNHVEKYNKHRKDLDQALNDSYSGKLVDYNKIADDAKNTALHAYGMNLHLDNKTEHYKKLK